MTMKVDEQTFKTQKCDVVLEKDGDCQMKKKIKNKYVSCISTVFDNTTVRITHEKET